MCDDAGAQRSVGWGGGGRSRCIVYHSYKVVMCDHSYTHTQE